MPRVPGSIICPFCQSAPISGIELFPMTLHWLDQAVECKKKQAALDKQDDAFAVAQAETSYLLLSHPSSTSKSDCQRTGRWTDEETELVDFLVQAFDHGSLPMPVGVRLNDFLCSVLLCKASRLTKKMKNARLSVRSYEVDVRKQLDGALLTTLQEKFLSSIPNDASRYEVRFNLEKTWRTHLSNLCVQVGYQQLDATAWIGSLEDMERRASEAEDRLRQARRHRMGLALKTDVRAQTGVFFSGMPMQKPKKSNDMNAAEPPAAEMVGSSAPGQEPQVDHLGRPRAESSNGECHSVTSSSDMSDNNHISNMLDIGESAHKFHPSGNFVDTMDDFAGIFTDLIECSHSVSSARSQDCGSFLERVLTYMEDQQMPFEHVDVWVPSYSPHSQGRPEDLRLFHAGHATREDLDPALYNHIVEYGEYSTKFSFRPGVGLPGRVYETNQPSWERRIDEADPKVFERAGGAKVYGIKTGVGIPVASKYIGGIVVAMYSMSDLSVDSDKLEKWTRDLEVFCPKPKWKLVVELEDNEMDESSTGFSRILPKPAPITSDLRHQMHSAPSQVSLMSDVGMLKQAPESIESDRDQEIRIASLLGDYMPGAEVPGPGESTSPENAPSLLLPHFMSLRLLLLRSPESRSQDENAMLSVIRKSFVGFSKDSSRSQKSIAHLLAKDWHFLRMSTDTEPKKPAAVAAPPTSPSTKPYVSHVMNAPSVSTYSAFGVPVSMPSFLGDAESMARRASFDDSGMVAKKRRISSADDSGI